MSRPKVAVAAVQWSPNLGDGVIWEAIEQRSGTGVDLVPIDLGGRSGYGARRRGKGRLYGALDRIPRPMAEAALAVLVPLKAAGTLARHHKTWGAVLDDADVLLVGGGHLLSDRHLNFPIKVSAVLTMAARRRLPTVVYGCGATRWSPVARVLFRRALARASLVDLSVRSEGDRDLVTAEVGGRAGPVRVVGDPALASMRPVWHRRRGPTRRPVIGICVGSATQMGLPGRGSNVGVALTAFYAAVADRICREHADVVLFTNGDAEDEHQLDALRRQDLEEPVSIADRPASPEALWHVVERCDVVVSHRLHSHVMATVCGAQSVGLVGDEKVASFLAHRRPPAPVLPLVLDDARAAALVALAALDQVRVGGEDEELLRGAAADLYQLGRLLRDLVEVSDGDPGRA
jgi:polysaccharide pyruvyl transferase WcaK-like protein